MHQIANSETSDSAIERDIQAKNLNAPRVTPALLAANIKHIEYVTHVSAGGQVLRWCVITTASGFAVTGRPSVAVSPENDDLVIGEKVAFENTRTELWPLMGYALKERLAGPSNEMVDSFLAWPLPDDVCADQIACSPGAAWRSGTNLLTAPQAKQMLQHVLSAG